MRAKLEADARERGMSFEQYVKKMEQIYEEEEEAGSLKVPMNLKDEQRSFQWLRVLVPPADSGEPAELEEVFEGIRSGDARRLTPTPGLEVAHKKIAKRWAINYTFLDEHWWAPCCAREVEC